MNLRSINKLVNPGSENVYEAVRDLQRSRTCKNFNSANRQWSRDDLRDAIADRKTFNDNRHKVLALSGASALGLGGIIGLGVMFDKNIKSQQQDQ